MPGTALCVLGSIVDLASLTCSLGTIAQSLGGLSTGVTAALTVPCGCGGRVPQTPHGAGTVINRCGPTEDVRGPPLRAAQPERGLDPTRHLMQRGLDAGRSCGNGYRSQVRCAQGLAFSLHAPVLLMTSMWFLTKYALHDWLETSSVRVEEQTVWSIVCSDLEPMEGQCRLHTHFTGCGFRCQPRAGHCACLCS